MTEDSRGTQTNLDRDCCAVQRLVSGWDRAEGDQVVSPVSH